MARGIPMGGRSNLRLTAYQRIGYNECMSDEPLTALKTLVKREGSQKDAARTLGISQAYLSDILNQRRDFSDRLLRLLGFRRMIVRRL